jgi:hypothetical protein
MSEAALARYDRRLSPDERGTAIAGRLPLGIEEEAVLRSNGSGIDLTVLDGLMKDFDRRRDAGEWSNDRATADRWLAPRVHYALRLTRDIASDRRIWEWLAVRYQTHTFWRWLDTNAVTVTEDHWFGPIHKQVMARLWWGGELFRDGPDYSPVERAFVRQDLINSYLHRPLVRCRSLALGILEVVAPANAPNQKSASEVNDLARVLNFATAGAPPELETHLQQDDWSGYANWAFQDAEMPGSWDPLPRGPETEDTTGESLEGGLRVARRGWEFATAGR